MDITDKSAIFTGAGRLEPINLDTQAFEKYSLVKNAPTVAFVEFNDQIDSLNSKKEEILKLRSEDLWSEFEDKRKEGYATGYEQGVAAATKEINEKNAGNTAALGKIRKKMISILEDKATEVNELISSSIANAFKQSFFLETTINTTHISSIVEAALKSLPIYASQICLELNSEDFDLINKTQPTILCKINDNMRRGEVIVTSDVQICKVLGNQMAKSIATEVLKSMSNDKC